MRGGQADVRGIVGGNCGDDAIQQEALGERLGCGSGRED